MSDMWSTHCCAVGKVLQEQGVAQLQILKPMIQEPAIQRPIQRVAEGQVPDLALVCLHQTTYRIVSHEGFQSGIVEARGIGCCKSRRGALHAGGPASANLHY